MNSSLKLISAVMYISREDHLNKADPCCVSTLSRISISDEMTGHYL